MPRAYSFVVQRALAEGSRGTEKAGCVLHSCHISSSEGTILLSKSSKSATTGERVTYKFGGQPRFNDVTPGTPGVSPTRLSIGDTMMRAIADSLTGIGEVVLLLLNAGRFCILPMASSLVRGG